MEEIANLVSDDVPSFWPIFQKNNQQDFIQVRLMNVDCTNCFQIIAETANQVLTEVCFEVGIQQFLPFQQIF